VIEEIWKLIGLAGHEFEGLVGKDQNDWRELD
jgi:hypothetical protein